MFWQGRALVARDVSGVLCAGTSGPPRLPAMFAITQCSCCWFVGFIRGHECSLYDIAACASGFIVTIAPIKAKLLI